MTVLSRVSPAMAFAAVFAIPGAAWAGRYDYEKISVPDAKSTFVQAINSNGVVIGTWSDRAGQPHSYVYRNGKVTKIDFPGAFSTTVNGINDDGVIVGYYQSTSRALGGGFILRDGKFATYDVPDAGYTILTGINNSGLIAGVFQNLQQDIYQHGFTVTPDEAFTQIPDDRGATLNGPVNAEGSVIGFDLTGAFVSSNGSTTYPHFPIGSFSLFNDINDAGSIVGSYFGTKTRFLNRGFVLTNGVRTDITAPGAKSTLATGINNAGTVVGAAWTDNEAIKGGFVYEDGRYRRLKLDRAKSVTPLAINDSGVIVGDYTNDAGLGFGFVATPKKGD